jgi:hypothetical protein
MAGVHGRNPGGKYVTIFKSPVYKAETTGLSFSPSGLHMYIAYQDQGVLLEITRVDGHPFHATTLNMKYHKDPNHVGAGVGGGVEGGSDGLGGGAVVVSRDGSGL